jgi:hypothetical protein
MGKKRLKCPKCGKMAWLLLQDGRVLVAAKPEADLKGWLCNDCYEKEDMHHGQQQGKV